jgi:hypothetical protein
MGWRGLSYTKLEQGCVMDYFEHDNKLSGASNCEEFLQYKRLYYHLKMASAPRIYSGV